MEGRAEDGGEAKIALPDEAAIAQRLFLARFGVLLLIAGILYLVWRIVAPVWQPILWAVLLGSVLAPSTARLARRLGGRPRLAASIVTVLAVLLFLMPVALVAGAVAAQSAQLLQRLQDYVPTLDRTLSLDLSRIPWLQGTLDWIGEHAGITLPQLQASLVSVTRNLLETLMSSGGSFVLGALGTLVSFMLMIFVLFFVLRDGPGIATRAIQLLPIERRRRDQLLQQLLEVTRAVFLGTGLTAVAQGTLLGIGFAIAGLPSPLVFGVLGVLFALIPLVGTVILWAPAALFLVSQGHPGYALFMAAWGTIVVGSADNILRPMLISGRSEVPTLVVFIGVMGGLSAFGFIGLFLGPIVLALVVALLRFQSEDTAARKRSS